MKGRECCTVWGREGWGGVDRVVLTPELAHIHTHLSSGINSRRPHTSAVLNSVVFLFEHFVDDT